VLVAGNPSATSSKQYKERFQLNTSTSTDVSSLVSATIRVYVVCEVEEPGAL